MFKEICRFVPERKMWYCYEGGIWKPDSGGLKSSELCKELADRLAAYATTIEDERQKADYGKYCWRWQQKKYRDTVMRDAQSVHPILMAKKKIEEVKIAVPAEGYFGRSLSNIVFTLYSRQLLLSKAAGKEAVHIEESYAKALKESKPAETGDFINVQKEAGNGSRGFEVTEKELVFTFPTSDDIPPAWYVNDATVSTNKLGEGKTYTVSSGLASNSKIIVVASMDSHARIRCNCADGQVCQRFGDSGKC